jgi:hypothetical protein
MGVSAIFSILVTSASALVCPPQRSFLAEGLDLIAKTHVTDNIEFYNAADFAEAKHMDVKDLERRYDASITFACDHDWAQAQVIVRSDVIIAPLHAFYKDDKCGEKHPLNKCGVIYKGQGKDEIFYIDKVLHEGKCPKGGKIPGTEDFVIFKMRKKLPETVKPYAVPKPGEELKLGQVIRVVGQSGDFNPTQAKIFRDQMKGFADCAAITRDPTYASNMVQTNCPGSHGCSACGIFKTSDQPVLIGIMIAELNPDEKCLNGAPAGRDGKFVKNCRGTAILPFEGDLLKTLRSIPAR